MTPTKRTTPARRRGFTLVELMVGVLILGVLLALLIVGVRAAISSTRGAVDKVAVASVRTGVDRFKQEFGFLPPLVRDRDVRVAAGERRVTGLPGGENAINVYSSGAAADRDALRARALGADEPDPRYSDSTLAFYLVGALDRAVNTSVSTPIDGIKGAGMLRPNADGTFDLPPSLKRSGPASNTRTGQRWEPFVVVGTRGMTLATSSTDPDDVRLVDRNNVAFRYYRWLPGRGTGSNPDLVENESDLNVPKLLTLTPGVAGPGLQGGSYAVVGAGPDQLFGDEWRLPTDDPRYQSVADMARRLGLDPSADRSLVEAAAARDNAVEVGR
jgi:prepilin-type N-terminal cleavage/methylation domain-containing protein